MIGDMFLSYSTQKAKARGSHFEASLGCIAIPCLKIKNITHKMLKFITKVKFPSKYGVHSFKRQSKAK